MLLNKETKSEQSKTIFVYGNILANSRFKFHIFGFSGRQQNVMTIFLSLSLSPPPLSLSLSIYIYIYVYIYTEREREWEREREKCNLKLLLYLVLILNFKNNQLFLLHSDKIIWFPVILIFWL